MSIINQVLKDIDKRSKEDVQGVRRRSSYAGRPRGARIWLWVLAGVLAAVFVVAVIYTLNQFQQQPTPLSAEEDMVVQFTPPQLPAGEDSDSQPEPAQQTASSRRQHRAEVRVIDAPSQPVHSQETEGQETETSEPEIFSADTLSTDTESSELSEDEVARTGVTQLTEQPPASETSEPAREPANEFSIQRSAPTSSSQSERLFNQALSDLDAGNARRASQSLQQVLILDPEHIEAREELAAYYFGRGFISDALEVLEGGLSLVPGANSLRLLQARILERIDQPERALAALQLAEISLPEDADLLILKGALATELEDYAIAASAYQQLVAWRPDQGRWWIGLALARESMDDHAGALQAYRRAMQDGSLNHSSREFVKDRMEALSF